MQLSDVIRTLELTTLKNANIGGNPTGGPTAFNYEELIEHINTGLLHIYQEFHFSTDEVVIQQFDNIQIYELHSDYAVSNATSTEPYKWIIDSVEKPFTDRVLLIESVYDEEGNMLPLNNDGEESSVYTPSPTSIQILTPSSENIVTVIYQKAHPKLAYDGDDLDTTLAQKIVLPLAAKNALCLYVAYAATEAHPKESERAESIRYLQKFNNEIARIRHNGIFIGNNPNNRKLENNGWL